jgi:lipoprotein-anchoring transpeptidase ErfK/SrfK
VRRAGLTAFLVLVLAAAGGLAAAAVAGPLGAVIGTTSTAPTSGSPTTAPTTAPQEPGQIPENVTIGGIAVGGLAPSQAYETVNAAFSRPVTLLVGRHRLAPSPSRLGASAKIAQAVEQARTAAPGTAVRLPVTVQRGPLSSYLDVVTRRFDRKPVDARLVLRGLRPWITSEQAGRRLDRRASVRLIVDALVANGRGPLRLPLKQLAPAVTRRDFGPVIVIRRGSNRLYFYGGMRLRRIFGVATGQSVYPTPLGRFYVAVKWRDPWWYPPPSPWAQGLRPVPPGPGNPLGTRWMGLSAAGVGIHGTPDDASIGYSVSHGCIRMHIADAEWLFVRVRIGTPVFIVAA